MDHRIDTPAAFGVVFYLNPMFCEIGMKRSFQKRFFEPVGAVFMVMALSWAVYFGSRTLENQSLFLILSHISGTTYFISIAFGTLFVYTVAYIRGASLKECILASAVNPFIWATKESLLQLRSFSIAESLYYYFNTLNIWLISFMVLEMGAATLIARKIIKKRGSEVQVLTPSPVAVTLGSLFFVVFIYAWGRGENLHSAFRWGYILLFGTGL